MIVTLRKRAGFRYTPNGIFEERFSPGTYAYLIGSQMVIKGGIHDGKEAKLVAVNLAYDRSFVDMSFEFADEYVRKNRFIRRLKYRTTGAPRFWWYCICIERKSREDSRAGDQGEP
jgi:hypothetical protein